MSPNQAIKEWYIRESRQVHQRYAQEVGMNESKSISTSMGTNGNLDSDASGNMVDQKLYRSMIGILLYVTASRPDVMFSVCMCARFQASPRESHLKATKRILRYLKHTQNVGLWYL